MNKLKFLFTGLLGIVLLSSFMAPKEKKDKNIEPKRVYMYGVSFNFNDSVVYMTDVLYLDSMMINKDGSLQNHSDYSYQLKTSLEWSLGKVNQTSAVIYSDNKKKLEKRYVKTRKKYQADNNKVLMKIDSSSFMFSKE